MLRLLLALLLTAAASAFELPASSSQCVLGIADGWDSSHVTLSFHEKKNGQWVATGPSWTGRLGKSGLVWGRGLHPVPANAALKKEGDLRSPAGVFAIGGAWGYDPAIRKHEKLFYRQVTSRDLWVEDPASDKYNHHLVLNREPSTSWEKSQQMKQNDYPHSLKLFIAHNAPPRVVPNGGSSIFFHIWRENGKRPTAGCTTMTEAKLREIISRIDPGKKPLYVLLPQQEYTRQRTAWKLP